MADTARAMTQTELFEKTGLVTDSRGPKALKMLLAGRRFSGMGQGDA